MSWEVISFMPTITSSFMVNVAYEPITLLNITSRLNKCGNMSPSPIQMHMQPLHYIGVEERREMECILLVGQFWAWIVIGLDEYLWVYLMQPLDEYSFVFNNGHCYFPIFVCHVASTCVWIHEISSMWNHFPFSSKILFRVCILRVYLMPCFPSSYVFLFCPND